MTTAYVVTDLGFGDAGKGTTVDFLARQKSTVVVRHNGGPQAGHNVITEDGRHHEFAQFGSGTLAGASTFLSRFMVINPLNMVREAEHLEKLGQSDIWGRTFIDDNALIVTPYHVALNRAFESERGNERHGSCGQGLGIAVQWALNFPETAIRVRDCISRSGLIQKLNTLRGILTAAKTWSESDPYFQTLTDPDLVQYLGDRYDCWFSGARVVQSDFLSHLVAQNDQVVFEGAQGVLLDQDYGFHPHTTWSTTTHANAMQLLAEIRYPRERVTRLGLIRTVTTRHGAGPHPTYDSELTESWKEPHNPTGRWQGEFRVGHLDLVMHRYAIKACDGIDQVVVTHCDRMNERAKFCTWYSEMRNISLYGTDDMDHRERMTKLMYLATPQYTECDRAGLMAAIEVNLGPIGLVSWGPTAKQKKMRSSETATV